MYRAVYRGVKKLRKVFSLKADNKAETGIGTLIIFIAMVLVAAVAATVLINTAGSLQQRATSTGSQTTNQVSTGLIVQSIYGMDNNRSNPESGSLNWTAIYVTLNTGSSPVDLSNVSLSLEYQGQLASLKYTPATTNASFAVDTNGTSNVFSVLNAGVGYKNSTATFKNVELKNVTKSTNFAIVVIRDPSNSLTSSHPVLTTGSEVVILVNTSAVFGGMKQGQAVTGQINPSVGSPGIIQFTTPSAFTETVMELQ
ncbi:flagellin [Oxyplasma meridianum]|uniref:Flagellin n=2 Tax=Oxyplasma meridianum TaxID=3073602 RepID=A0AAX4NFB8_9ARCH